MSGFAYGERGADAPQMHSDHFSAILLLSYSTYSGISARFLRSTCPGVTFTTKVSYSSNLYDEPPIAPRNIPNDYSINKGNYLPATRDA